MTLNEKEKPTSTIEHLEHAYDGDGDGDLAEKGSVTEVHVAALDGDGLVKSRFDTLSIGQALWVFRRSLAVCFAVFTGRMLEYFEIVMCGSILANPGFIAHFGDPGRGRGGVAALDPNWVSAWSVVGPAAQILTMYFIIPVTDKWGRKPSLLIAWGFIAIAMLCLTVARTKGVWLAGRLFTGAGTGIVAVVAAPYGMEICATRIRGIVLSAAILWGAVATLLGCVMMNELTLRHPMNWHLPVYAAWGPVGLMLVCFAVIPESPWFHARKGDKAKTLKVLKFLYGNIEGYDYEEEYGIILKTIDHERQQIRLNKASGWTDLFKGTNGKRTLIALIITASVQLGGYPILYTFSTYTYAFAGFKNPFQTIIITSCVQCAFVIGMMVVFDKFGRRMFVTWGYTLQATSMLCWGCMAYLKKTHPGRMSALTFIACFWSATATVAGNSQTIYTAELPAAYLRIKTGVLCYSFMAALGIAMNFAAPRMLNTLNLKSGFIFFATAVPLAGLLWYLLPETKGRSAAEIDELYERGVPAWRWAKTRTAAEEQLEEAMQQRAAENAARGDAKAAN